MRLVLDTCALLWLSLEPESLSQKARRYCERIPETGCLIASISFFEIGLKVKSKKLSIGMSIDEFYENVVSTNMFEIVSIDEQIWFSSLKLRWEHRDPIDRIIVAIAKLNNAFLLTKDEKMRKFYKQSIW